MLFTNPLPTGFPTPVITMGIVLVAARAASVVVLSRRGRKRKRSDTPDLAGLLGTGGNRPSRRAADDCHKLAPFQLVELHSPPDDDRVSFGREQPTPSAPTADRFPAATGRSRSAWSASLPLQVRRPSSLSPRRRRP